MLFRKLLAVVLMLRCCGSAIAAEDFSIDTFHFSWKVATSDKLELSIDKTQDRTNVSLHKDFSYLTLTPAAAEQIGTALKQTEDQFKKLKDRKDDASEKVKAGDYEVRYATTPKVGFYISISDSSRTFDSTFILTRAQAKAITPHLLKAKAMVKFVDEKIKL